MSLKKIFLKTSITYKLYIYYNLYIRNKAFKKREFYSQWGEDLLISNFFKNKSDGFYVDIGSFHPIMYNNTCRLFNNGWSGINIDLNQTSIDMFNIIRPKDFNICAAISDKAEEKYVYFDDHFSPVNTITRSFYENSNKEISFKDLKKKKIFTKKFGEVAQKIPNLPKIDFLNIDCEGHDFQVLNGFNLQYYKPELICIETHNVDNTETSFYNDVLKLLHSQKYVLLDRRGPSSIFKKE